ncbi:hypothetical protein STENM223S_00457 [Streptomyces tendae]
MPTQNGGVDWPSRTPVITVLSVPRPRRTAATMPAGIATTRVSASAAAASSTVAGSRSARISLTGCP